jgi:DNA-binding transcriptional ArsR family regulator
MKTKAVVAALGALAQDTRLAIFRLLVQRGPDGMPAGTIAEALKVHPSSMSFHLAQLVHAGLIVQRRAGRQLIYSAAYDRMNALIGYLTENCCQGDAAACGLPACAPTATPQPPTRRRTAA